LNEFDDIVKFFRREMQTTIDDLNNKITELTTKADHTEKQIARMVMHDQLFKRIFEFYADLLDPEEYKRSGPNVTAFKTEFTRGPGRGDTCHLSFLDETLPD